MLRSLVPGHSSWPCGISKSVATNQYQVRFQIRVPARISTRRFLILSSLVGRNHAWNGAKRFIRPAVRPSS